MRRSRGRHPNQPFYGQPQGPYPPQGGYPPPQGGYPQPGYPPQGQPGFTPGYPPQPGFAPPPTAPFHMPPPNDSGGYGGGGGYIDPEDPSVKGFEFNDQSIRRAFMRKVYSILTLQLVVTFGMIALFRFHQGTNDWVRANPSLFWVAFGVMIVTMLVMACCGDVRRKAPMNFVFLGLFTLAQGFMLGITTLAFKVDEVMLAVGITAVVCFGLTIFALQTKWDFTVMGGVLFVMVLVLMIFGIVAIFWRNSIVHLIYGCLGALIFSFYLIYDTQLMMGGKHKYSISPEEYIFAALNLYLDIINIFLYILTIIGSQRD